MRVITVLFSLALCYDPSVQNPLTTAVPEPTTGVELHTGLTERIGNFSIELLYQTSKSLQDGQNFIMSPITVWSVLAVIAEGASDTTRYEITNALRTPSKISKIRTEFRNITQWLQVNTNTVQLAKINAIFVDRQRLPLPDFVDTARTYYQSELITLNFTDSVYTANLLNQAISNLTHGLIPKIVNPDYFQDTQMVITSAVYFKGQWSMPFNASSTSQMPFYNSKGEKIGDVNMMYNKHTYPFSNMRELQARVIELPYGKENRLSMLIMLPNPGVSLEDMFSNFLKVNLDKFFEDLRISKEEYSDDEVDCYIPRFKIESDLDLTNILKDFFSIREVFDPAQAKLPYMARMPLYVSKVIHKARIEVTEEGTTAAGVTVAEFSNRIGALQFQANRPFTYIIVEKVTNSIVFGGFYKEPSLY